MAPSEAVLSMAGLMCSRFGRIGMQDGRDERSMGDTHAVSWRARVRRLAWPQFFQGVSDCLPTVVGYWTLGFAVGAIATLSHFSAGEAIAAAALLYSGSAQLLLFSVLKAGGDAVAAALSVAMVNMRYVLSSAYLAPHLGGQAAWRRMLTGFLLTDETFGIVSLRAARGEPLPFSWLAGVEVTAYLNWVSANAVGALAAKVTPPRLAASLSFSLVAMFIGLVAVNLRESRSPRTEAVVIVAALVLAMLLRPILIPDLSVLVAALFSASLALMAGPQRHGG